MSAGPWSRNQRLKNDVLYRAAAASIHLGLALPRSWLPRIGAAVGQLAYVLFAGARRTARSNLALARSRASGAEDAPSARDVFRTLGQNLTDTLALLDPTEDPGRTLGITMASRSVLDAALGAGRGVVYVTCHLGPWERMAALLAALGYPITTLARESYDPRFDAFLYRRLRSARKVEVISRGAPTAPTAIVRALKRGRVLGFLVDLAGTRVPICPVEWLGLPSAIAVGPARIALRTGAPVVVGTPAPAKRGLELQITSLRTDDLRSDASGERVLCQRIADELSRRIFALPDHWPWMHRSFPTSQPRELAGSASHFGLVQ